MVPVLIEAIVQVPLKPLPPLTLETTTVLPDTYRDGSAAVSVMVATPLEHDAP